jgi:hypothetical protein
MAFVALACASGAWAQGGIVNGDFEAGLANWEARTSEGGRVAISTDRPAQGKSALLVQTTGGVPAWAVSEGLTGVSAGEVWVLTYSVRRLSGTATLALNMVAGAAPLTEAVIWEALVPEDQKWHRVALMLKVPPTAAGEPLRLAFGALGQQGAWLVDDLNLTKGTLPGEKAHEAWGQPCATGRMAGDWKPDSLPATQPTQVGSQTEWVANVNGIDVHLLTEATCYRGFREPLVLFAVNRGKVDKELQVRVEAPVGVECPSWTIPVKGDGTTRFHLAVQSLRQGEFWVQTFWTSAGQTKTLPLKIKCLRSYPVVGTAWQNEVDPQQLQAVLAVPADMQLLQGNPLSPALGAMLQAVQAQGSEGIALPECGQLTAAAYTAALKDLAGALLPSFWIPYYEAEGSWQAPADAAPVLARFLRDKQSTAGVFTPPLQVRRDWTRGRLMPTNAGMLTAEHTVGLMATTVRMPKLGAPVVVGEQVDGKSEVVSGGLASLGRQADLAATRAVLVDRGVSLPILVNSLQARTSGDERLDALYLARTLCSIFYQGSTGVALQPRRTTDNGLGLQPTRDEKGNLRPVPAVVAELQQELGSASPVVALAASKDISPAPDAQVTYLPFVRAGEGIVVLWNNTGISRDITLEFRSQPVVVHQLRLSYRGEFVDRRWDPIFKFSPEAFKQRKPAIFTRIDPLEVLVISAHLLDPHAAWMANISYTPPPGTVLPPLGPPKEGRSWWKDMLPHGGSL